MPDLGNLLSLFGGAPAAGPDLLGTGVPPDNTTPVSSTVAPTTTAPAAALPGAPTVLARVRTTPGGAQPAAAGPAGPSPGLNGGLKNFMSPLSGLAGIKANPGDRVAAFAQAFGQSLKSAAEQQAAEAKAATEREDLLRKRANDLFEHSIKLRQAGREDNKDAREGARAHEESEAGGVDARTKTADRLKLKGDERTRYIATGDMPKDVDQDESKLMENRTRALESFRRAKGLKGDDDARKNFGEGTMTKEERKKAQDEVAAFAKRLGLDPDGTPVAPIPKTGNKGRVAAPSTPAPAGDDDEEAAPAAPATPAAPGAPAAATPAPAAPAAAQPLHIRNPSTGEVRQWDPSSGTYVPVQVPTPPPAEGADVGSANMRPIVIPR